MKINKIIMIFSICLYFSCLFFPSFSILEEPNEQNPSWIVLLSGFFGIASSVANLTWLANPILFLSWRSFFHNNKISAIVGCLIALVLSVGFSFFKTVVVNGGTHINTVTGLGAGYWLWVASMAMALLASLLMPNERSDEGEDAGDAQN